MRCSTRSILRALNRRACESQSTSNWRIPYLQNFDIDSSLHARSLVWRREFDVIDHQNLSLVFASHEPEAHLLLKRSE